MEILHRDDLPLGGFASLKEHQLVMDQKLSGRSGDKGSWNGIGNFVYLADAIFKPHGETRMHPHNEINPDDTKNRMIQLWVLPEVPGEPAGYKYYQLEDGKVTRIYGGVGGCGMFMRPKP